MRCIVPPELIRSNISIAVYRQNAIGSYKQRIFCCCHLWKQTSICQIISVSCAKFGCYRSRYNINFRNIGFSYSESNFQRCFRSRIYKIDRSIAGSSFRQFSFGIITVFIRYCDCRSSSRILTAINSDSHISCYIYFDVIIDLKLNAMLSSIIQVWRTCSYIRPENSVIHIYLWDGFVSWDNTPVAQIKTVVDTRPWSKHFFCIHPTQTEKYRKN